MSVESLAKRATKGEPRSINPLVDFYNSISLKHFVTAGAFDCKHLEREMGTPLVTLGITDKHSFKALDGEEETSVPAGKGFS